MGEYIVDVDEIPIQIENINQQPSIENTEQTELFSNQPEIIEEYIDLRPFFSIVVPCYNPGKYMRDLLNSIVNQHMSYNEIEVLLVDDHSTEPYDNIIAEYQDKLNIVRLQTEYNCCPGNTRQVGAAAASGYWLTFVDQDDVLIENAYQEVKKRLIESQEPFYAVSNFIQINPLTNTIVREVKQARNWCHGKFFNVDNFWKKYNFHFKKNLKSHEDIYISALVIYYLHLLNNDRYLELDFNTMLWRAWPESLSRRQYKGNRNNFLEVYFDDYIESTGWAYINLYKTDTYNPDYDYWCTRDDFMFKACINCFLFVYFYMQGFKFFSTNYIPQNFNYALKYYNEIKKLFHVTARQILDFIYENPNYYFSVRESSYIGSGYFIEQDTLEEFIIALEEEKDTPHRYEKSGQE